MQARLGLRKHWEAINLTTALVEDLPYDKATGVDKAWSLHSARLLAGQRSQQASVGSRIRADPRCCGGTKGRPQVGVGVKSLSSIFKIKQ